MTRAKRRSVPAACLVLLLATLHPLRRPPVAITATAPTTATALTTTTSTATTIVSTSTTTTVPVPRPARRRASRSSAPRRTPVPAPPPWAEVRDHIAACESSGDPTARNAHSSASGLYQAIRGTWHGYGGYPSAADAPVEVQERHAAELYARRGLQPWRASARCWRRRLGR